jgi:hypothetical protein
MSLSHLPRTTGLFEHYNSPSPRPATRGKSSERELAEPDGGRLWLPKSWLPKLKSRRAPVPARVTAIAREQQEGPHRTAPISLAPMSAHGRQAHAVQRGPFEAMRRTIAHCIGQRQLACPDAAARNVDGDPSDVERPPPRMSESKSPVTYRCSCRRPPPPVAYSRHGTSKSARQCDKVKKFLQRCRNPTL